MLLRALAEGGVDFVVIGGYAAIAHGATRFTFALDVSSAPAPDTLDRLGAVLQDLGARLRGIPEEVPFVPDARAIRQMRVMTLDTAEGPLDLLAEPAGSPGYAALRASALEVDLDGVLVPVASLEHLIAMKRAAARPKDLLDLEELEVIARLRDA